MYSDSKLYLEDLEYIANSDIEWNLLYGKTVLVIGATGLIGTVLVDALMYRNRNYDSNIKILAMAFS